MKKPPGTLAWVFTLQVYLRRFCFTSSSLKFGMTHGYVYVRFSLCNCRDVWFRACGFRLRNVPCFSFIRILLRATTGEQEHGGQTDHRQGEGEQVDPEEAVR